MTREVLISQPNNGSPLVAEFKLNSPSPYELVKAVPLNQQSFKPSTQKRFSDYLIGEILPIHNLSGIRDQRQINQMKDQISQGKHINQKDGIPNIKLIVAPDDSLLLFDGTHSLLAYFQSGRAKIREVPFLLISSEDFEPVTEEELAYFFPEDYRDKVRKNWKSFVVNWQATAENQLEEREVFSIKELAGQLGK
jgi:hypothetical protein